MKKRQIWFNLQRDETGNGLSKIKDTFAESLQLQMSVLYLQDWSLKSGSYDGWAKCKKSTYPHTKTNRGLAEINRSN